MYVVKRNKCLHASQRIGLIVILVGLGMLFSGCASQTSILYPHGPSADRIATLSWALFATAAIAFIIVVALLCVAIFRKRTATVGTLPNDKRTLTLVIVAGAIIPTIVLAILMGLGIYTEQALASPPGDPQYTILVRGL